MTISTARERPVQFDVLEMHSDVQVVHSLAKWKGWRSSAMASAPAAAPTLT